MAEINPYAAPKAEVGGTALFDEAATARLNRVAWGQRLIIYSILGSFVAMALQAGIWLVGVLVGVAASVVAVIGVVHIGAGLERSALAKIVYAVAVFVPLLGLLVMIALSVQATKALRAGGYEVGFFGAKPR